MADLWIHYEDDEPMALVRKRKASPADLLAAVRAAVESGTIEGEEERRCVVHNSRRFALNEQMCEHVEWMKSNSTHFAGQPCEMTNVLVIPLVERGEGGNK